MTEPDVSRSIQLTFEGPGVSPGWVPVSELVVALDGLQDALTIVMEDLWGRAHTRGPVPLNIEQQATLRFGNVRAGSFVASLELEPLKEAATQLFDPQPQAIDRLMSGVALLVAGKASELPVDATRKIEGVMTRVGRSSGRLTLEGGTQRTRVVMSSQTLLPERVSEVVSEARPVEVSGRLLEIDYRDHTAEVWDAAGHMTRVRFTNEQRARVDAARRQHVTVQGTAESAIRGRASMVAMESVVVVPKGEDFWKDASVADLAVRQGVGPLQDPAGLVASFWLEDDEDDFLAALARWRREA